MIEIKNRWDGKVIYQSEKATLREALEEAVRKGADLRSANLGYANLGYANLGSADLRSANLGSADLRSANLGYANLGYANLGYANLGYANLGSANLGYANLGYANLGYADLRYANLGSADLRSADLRYANLGSADLRYANLGSADLRSANLPSPLVVFLANWGDLPDDLTADLMLFDASAHPDPARFDAWAKGGDCPYSNRILVGRAANFREKRDLWGTGKHCRPYDLMVRILAAKCPQWTEGQAAEHAAKFQKTAV